MLAVLAFAVASPRVVAQYYGTYPNYPPEALDFGTITHLVLGVRDDDLRLVVGDDGSVQPCSQVAQLWNNYTKQAHKLARMHGRKVQIGFPEDGALIEKLMYNDTARKRFMATVAPALKACDVDGFEIDWEGPGSPKEADDLTQWMIQVKQALGPGSVLSLDSEPPQWSDYYRLNASRMDGTNIDFVNYMSYFYGTADGSIAEWEKAADMLLSQGFPASTINLAIPYYQQTGGSSEWELICPSCPNLDPIKSDCNGSNVVSKTMNEKIGALAARRGLGVFPWVLDYDVAPTDSKTCGNNSFFPWLQRGLAEPATVVV